MAENTEQGNDAPKIHIDSDWKAQAKAEKERLAREIEQKQAAKKPAGQAPKPTQPSQPQAEPAAAPGAAEDEEAYGGEMPEASFETLVHSTASQALMALGAIPDPMSGRRMLHMPLAKFHIDTLSMLVEKTRGNLSTEESQMLEHVLYETRMFYVQRAQQVADSNQPGAEANPPQA